MKLWDFRPNKSNFNARFLKYISILIWSELNSWVVHPYFHRNAQGFLRILWRCDSSSIRSNWIVHIEHTTTKVIYGSEHLDLRKAAWMAQNTNYRLPNNESHISSSNNVEISHSKCPELFNICSFMHSSHNKYYRICNPDSLHSWTGNWKVFRFCLKLLQFKTVFNLHNAIS